MEVQLTNIAAVEGTKNIKFTEWELKNLHLPPITTITLYKGSAPIEYLRNRLAIMLERNPWLTSRIVKKDTPDGIVALTFSKVFDAEHVIDRHLTVYEPGDVGFSLGRPYEELVRCLLPVQCVRSKPATDKDEVLFKVAVVPVETGAEASSSTMPLQRAIASSGFALVVSMNHTLGDGHTYYKLYSMLSADAEVDELDPVRINGFEEAKSEIIGEKETAMFKSAGLGLGIVGTFLGAKLTRREPQNVCVHAVDPVWVTQEKDKAKQAGKVPFVSTNDALTSWFFSEMKSDLNIMVANFRSRKPSILGLVDHHVGNYEANIPYFPGDVETPAVIRQSIRDANGAFGAKRAGSPETETPSFWKLLCNKTAIITNWATFYRDVNLKADTLDNPESTLTPELHLPIMEPDGFITSVWNSAIIFRPRAGETGMLMITRHFDSNMLIQIKKQEGPSVPLGKRIV